MASAIARRALAVLRIAFGLTFLWAFLDKLLALGYSTGAVLNDQGVKTGTDWFGKDAWIHGGNPTQGFLKFGASGPFEGLYHAIAGEAWVNISFIDDHDHILGALSMVVRGLTLAGDSWGAGTSWARTPLVRRLPVLR